MHPSHKCGLTHTLLYVVKWFKHKGECLAQFMPLFWNSDEKKGLTGCRSSPGFATEQNQDLN